MSNRIAKNYQKEELLNAALKKQKTYQKQNIEVLEKVTTTIFVLHAFLNFEDVTAINGLYDQYKFRTCSGLLKNFVNLFY